MKIPPHYRVIMEQISTIYNNSEAGHLSLTSTDIEERIGVDLKKLGEGRSRAAFKLDKNFVIKYDYSPKGVYNKSEWLFYRSLPEDLRDLFCPIYTISKNFKAAIYRKATKKVSLQDKYSVRRQLLDLVDYIESKEDTLGIPRKKIETIKQTIDYAVSDLVLPNIGKIQGQVVLLDYQ